MTDGRQDQSNWSDLVQTDHSLDDRWNVGESMEVMRLAVAVG